MAGPVKAYAWPQGTTAGIVGPARSRIRQVVIYAETAGSFTMKNGTGSGDDLIVQPFPVGMHVLNIPDDGVLATDGVYVNAFTGSNNDLTIFLS
tara:strand:+ start:689 stop:970 length:282 start_codon:yes stop_codon:yes gene_type:complete